MYPRLTYSLIVVLVSAPSFADEAVDLFANDSFEKWTAQSGEPVREGWQVENGVVHFDPSRGRGGNIVTADEVGDFELSFEFRIAEKGNSGIKYRVRKYGKRVLGLEYQILDDPAYPKQQPKHFTASLYDIKEPAGPVAKTGEFNRGRILVRNNHIQHWLNGQLVVSQTVDSGDWSERVAQSKFKDIEGFSTNQRGKLMLTDHKSEVWYRNVRLRTFSSSQTAPPAIAQSQISGWYPFPVQSACTAPICGVVPVYAPTVMVGSAWCQSPRRAARNCGRNLPPVRLRRSRWR